MGDVGRRGPAAGGCVWKLPVVHRHLAAQSPEGRWSPLPIIRSHPGKFRALTLTGLAYCMLTASVQPSLKRLLPQGLMDLQRVTCVIAAHFSLPPPLLQCPALHPPPYFSLTKVLVGSTLTLSSSIRAPLRSQSDHTSPLPVHSTSCSRSYGSLIPPPFPSPHILHALLSLRGTSQPPLSLHRSPPANPHRLQSSGAGLRSCVLTAECDGGASC